MTEHEKETLRLHILSEHWANVANTHMRMNGDLKSIIEIQKKEILEWQAKLEEALEDNFQQKIEIKHLERALKLVGKEQQNVQHQSDGTVLSSDNEPSESGRKRKKS